MLDPKFVREHLDEVKRNCEQRHVNINFDAFIALDEERLHVLKETEKLRAERNDIAERMKTAKDQVERGPFIARGKELKDLIAEKEARFEECERSWKEMLYRIPNLTHPDSPVGQDDSENLELRRSGTVRQLEKPLTHVELAEKHDLIDFVRGAKVAGAKFYFLKNQAVLLEQALIRFAMDRLVRDGFTPIATPDLAKDEVLLGTGFNPRGPETQIYSIENTDLSLVGTAEIPMGGFHMDEMLNEEALPRKYVALSHCYRTEAGAYGRESYGLYRVHQFSKVEMFVFCTPEQSEAMHLELLRQEEELFQALEIPYRVVDICTGDLGGPAYRKYDLEAWMWGRSDGKGDWGEVTSTSNCTDYQARRLNIRVKSHDKENRFAHTLNGTAIALSRGLIALLENHQQPDGGIKIPAALVPYCGFEKIG